MGHQQILFALLGVLLVGIAIAVGIAMFRGNAVEQGRTALILDLQFIASRAREAYLKPAVLGGVERNFSSRIDSFRPCLRTKTDGILSNNQASMN
jgi:hypothetical protein